LLPIQREGGMKKSNFLLWLVIGIALAGALAGMIVFWLVLFAEPAPGPFIYELQ
jgi:hypothetical protein